MHGHVPWALLCSALLAAPGVVRAAGDDYFPAPEAEGGWRALVKPNQTPTADQQRAVREKAGLDWSKLKEAQDYCAGFGGPSHLLVIRHGWIAAEWTSLAQPRGIASCTKSLTALAMARLFDLSDAGKLPKPIGVEDEAWRFLPPEWGEAEPARKAIRIRHMLTMTSGLTPYDGPYKEDYLQQVFGQKVEAPPGTVWAYASVPVDMLSLIIESVTGLKEDAFFNRQINAAIGAASVEWGSFSGHTGGSGGPGGGARFPACDLARVGYLVLHDGAWQRNGQRQQVISAARIREFTRAAPFLEKATWRQPNFASERNANRFYGHLWWTNRTGEALGESVPRDAVYMSGWGKQACFVVPGLDMIVVRIGPDRKLNEHPEYYRELWKRLMAAVTDAPAAPPVRTVERWDTHGITLTSDRDYADPSTYEMGDPLPRMEKSPTPRLLQVLAGVMSRVPYWEMAPANEAVNAAPAALDGVDYRTNFALAKRGGVWLVYSRHGGAVDAQAGAGRWRALRVDPRTGRETPLGEFAGSIVQAPCPQQAESVVILSRVNTPSP